MNRAMGARLNLSLEHDMTGSRSGPPHSCRLSGQVPTLNDPGLAFNHVQNRLGFWLRRTLRRGEATTVFTEAQQKVAGVCRIGYRVIFGDDSRSNHSLELTVERLHSFGGS